MKPGKSLNINPMKKKSKLLIGSMLSAILNVQCLHPIEQSLYTKISLTELVKGLVLLILPIYFNALECTTVLGITYYL